MSSIGIIIKNGLGLSKKLPKVKKDAFKSQQKVLAKLLRKAQFTIFGQEHRFDEILMSDNMIEAYRKHVPIYTYETIYPWWRMILEGETSVTWPGKVDYFALSSGTSTGSSKYIPVTRSTLRSLQKASIKQIMSLAHYDLPQEFFEKDIMMLGGSTNLDYNGIYYAGDLSGITQSNLPFWFQPYYKPGKEIAKTRNWQEKLDYITKEAHKWDVGAIAGAPSWFTVLFERIVEYHKVKNIHEIWPNLRVFIYGAVALEPYKKTFESLLAHPLIYLETYLASEGFIAYQSRPGAEGMQLLVRNGIFFEFVPFNEENVDADGNVKENAQVFTINDVKENEDYVLVMSTVSGAWRYIIGDVIRFTDVPRAEIRIVGRTKHYISLTGEHLSVDNMNRAVEQTQEDLNIKVKEFTVSGIKTNGLFGHHWFMAVDGETTPEQLREKIDLHLKQLNDDYRIEREHVLKEMVLDIVPNDLFLSYLKAQGKEGAQIKFPRVLKKDQYLSWIEYLKEHNFTPTKVNLE